jgi:ubiquinone/menaquinone biosynthesis C-methylase UbiE
MALHDSHRVIPALGFSSLTRLYDPFVRLLIRETEFRRKLIAQADVRAGAAVLDVGCGTGTLALRILEAVASASVAGLDADEKVLEIAREKAARAGAAIAFERGMASELPYAAASFDRVVCTMMLHHLTSEDKRSAFTEIFRVLRPGGELHVADFGPPETFIARIASVLVRHSGRGADNLEGKLPGMMSDAGFDPVLPTGTHETIFGTITFQRAVKPLR